jgi:hypothetical protein
MDELEKRKAKLNAEFDETLDHLRREKIWLMCGERNGVEMTDVGWIEYNRKATLFKESVKRRDEIERLNYIIKQQKAIDRVHKPGSI